jgi:hypothetical protein
MTDFTYMNQSRIKLFRRCQKAYAMRYDYPANFGHGGRIEMVRKVPKVQLYRGSWMHALQQGLHHQWAGTGSWEFTYGEGRHAIKAEVNKWQDIHALLSEEFEKLFLEEREELGDLPTECESLFKSYLRFWDTDQDTYSVATLPNGEPAIEFIVETDLDKFGIENAAFKGRVDLLVEDDEYGGLWIWDAKWMKKVPPPDERMMSPQSPLYVWALRKQYDLDVRGFLYNYGRTKPPTEPRLLKRGTLSVAKKMDTDQFTYMRAIKRAHGKYYKNFMPYYKEKLMELRGREALWFDRQRIPIEDEKILRTVREYVATVRDIQRRETRPEYVPRSYFYNCRFGCDYHGPCVAEYQGLDIEPLISQDYQFVGERYEREDLLNA